MTPLASIVGEGRSRVEARFSGRLATDLGFEFVAPGGEAYALRRAPDGSVVLPDDGTTLEWFEFDDESVHLPGGLQGRVRALGGGDVLQVPAGALRRGDEGALLFIRNGESRREVRVRVLASTGASALVTSDSLHIGDEVVADIASVLASEAAND